MLYQNTSLFFDATHGRRKRGAVSLYALPMPFARFNALRGSLTCFFPHHGQNVALSGISFLHFTQTTYLSLQSFGKIRG